MNDLTILTFEEVFETLGMSMDFWNRVAGLSKKEQIQEARRELTWPEGFLEMLKGKPLEEQMEYYRVVEESYHSRTAYGEITSTNKHEYGYALKDYPGLNALIVEDGVLIGACIDRFAASKWWGAPAYPYENVCTYFASDNNGSGTKDCIDYAHLCCVMPENEKKCEGILKYD